MSTLSVDTIQGKTTAGTVAMPSGHIVQVARTYVASSSHISTTSTSLVASGIQCSLTPKFSNSLIIVDYISAMAATTASNHKLSGMMYLKVGSASIAAMSGAGTYHLTYSRDYNYQPIAFGGSYTATSTDTLMFEPYYKSHSGDTVYLVHSASSYSLTVTEIKQ
tara:strand:+ start:404 stop:895 length:492 start_codon:yes stop_codon:yes gene_type:complete